MRFIRSRWAIVEGWWTSSFMTAEQLRHERTWADTHGHTRNDGPDTAIQKQQSTSTMLDASELFAFKSVPSRRADQLGPSLMLRNNDSSRALDPITEP